MKSVIAVFRSRAESIKLSTALSEAGVRSTLITTPRELKLGCGLSVRVAEPLFFAMRTVQRRGTYRTFVGYFEFERNGTKSNLGPLK